MQIWIDGDACPLVIKNIIFRAAQRTRTQVILVANQSIAIPVSPFIKAIRVLAGFDKADNEIINQVINGDLVVTADVPLADAVIEKGAIALNPRGELYTLDNIKQRRAIRDLNEQLRNSGIPTGRIPKLSPREVQNFANSLDKYLTQATTINLR